MSEYLAIDPNPRFQADTMAERTDGQFNRIIHCILRDISPKQLPNERVIFERTCMGNRAKSSLRGLM